jgi:hypothetical protein
MARQIRILLQTTIPTIEDNWHIGRFSLLQEHLAGITDDGGAPVFHVIARDRATNVGADDPTLSRLDTTDFDELWLFAVDAGDGLSTADCKGITRFRQRGGGLLTTRDHQDLGSSLCTLGGVGGAHYFHSKQQHPDPSRHTRDDQDTVDISWPNYHSGSNGDYQRITAVEPVHDLLRSASSTSGLIEFFPAHPHEGDVGVPAGETHARVIATGVSKLSGQPFNLGVAFESAFDAHGNMLGRAVADSSFHHFVDYNWDTTKGCPGFLREPPGYEIKHDPQKLSDVKSYVRNLALWLAGEPIRVTN